MLFWVKSILNDFVFLLKSICKKLKRLVTFKFKYIIWHFNVFIEVLKVLNIIFQIFLIWFMYELIKSSRWNSKILKCVKYFCHAFHSVVNLLCSVKPKQFLWLFLVQLFFNHLARLNLCSFTPRAIWSFSCFRSKCCSWSLKI